ncbi:Putative cytochrome c family protein, OhcA-like [Desulfonema limicola]|uniref:Cytochrome c family protein, OhcA-like n=1 Tax=Desulfonema limicola TaxID=45656 RepID=A0A975GH11_9BACT|nr:Putative cytochrome c family protein, OhcA-like [Desulfonema limicola]
MKLFKYRFFACKVFVFIVFLSFLHVSAAFTTVLDETAPGLTMARQATHSAKLWITSDHSKHEILQQEFTSGPEVTKACLYCHSEAASQFHKTIHWTWLDPNVDKKEMIGKGGYSVNNFCINLISNEPRCTSCHAGYGWKDQTFDFTDQSKVDCLVCHEQTGTYKKFPTGAGNPVTEPTVFKENGKEYLPPEWNKVAQSVGRPTRKNCGTCHFSGGGGDGVKHGDMDSSLMKPNKALDVHMGEDGQNFDCVRCHTTVLHNIAGRTYSTPAATSRKSLIEDDLTSKITCESCHSSSPHKSHSKMNDHTDKVACQSCHIPEYARVNPTKMWWDWSTAGRKKDGKPYEEKGEHGKAEYSSKKGSFVWEKNVKPEYFWYNGSIYSLTARDTIDPSKIVQVNRPLGSPDDVNSRISPFKVHKGKQPYDKENKTLLIPHLFGKKESGAYWADFDWKKSLASGMEKAALPFSGEFDFVETTYVFPTTHMVAPRENALSCNECHTNNNSRLANLGGFYMPGRDKSNLVNTGGWTLAALSFIGVILHGFIRIFTKSKPKKEK